MNTLEDSTVGTIELAGKEVRRLGFGAMRISGARDASGTRNRETAVDLVRAVVDRGVNLIDTADIYGYGESEEIIAEALHPYADDLLITTKAGFRPGKILPGHVSLPAQGDPADIKAACEGSLRRLKVETIDLLQVHVPDTTVPYEDTLGAFVDLREEGKIRHIGVSNVVPMQLDLARSLFEVASVQNRYNAGDRTADAVLRSCDEHGIAFMPWGPLSVENAKASRALAEIADTHDALPQQVALRWLLHRSPMMLPIPGTSQTGHAHENIDAAWLELSAAELELLDGVL